MHTQKFILGILLLTIGACASSAPPLPMDTTASNSRGIVSQRSFTASDLSKNCADIKMEQMSNADKMASDNKAIAANRKQNEVAGYLGGMILVPLIATENNSAEKDDIAMLQRRQDVLLKLSAFRQCYN